MADRAEPIMEEREDNSEEELKMDNRVDGNRVIPEGS